MLLTHSFEIAQLVLVALLGFLPLIIIHWAYHRPRLHLPHVPHPTLRLAVNAKAAALILITHVVVRLRV